MLPATHREATVHMLVLLQHIHNASPELATFDGPHERLRIAYQYEGIAGSREHDIDPLRRA